jgi:hypothetical protein
VEAGEETSGEISMTWTSSSLLALTALLILPPAAAPHESGGGISGGGDLDFGGGYDIPRFDSNAEIAYYFFAPFVFVAVLFKTMFHLFFNEVVDSSGSASYSRITTLMALSVTGVLIPSPFWNYVILAMNSIVLIGVGTLVLMFLLIFIWTAQAGSDDPRP